MANFSTLFPNLQTDLDFLTEAEATAAETATAGSSQGHVAAFAEASNVNEANPTNKIPAKLLPDLMSGRVFTGTSTQATDADALDSFVGAFNAATASANGVVEGITVNSGATISPGDTVIITNSASTANTETYVYVGSADVVAPADISAADFRDVSYSGDTVESIAAGDTSGNITIGGTAVGSKFITDVTIALDSTLTGIASISNTGGNLSLGDSGQTTSILGHADVAGDTSVVKFTASGVASLSNASVSLGGVEGAASAGSILPTSKIAVLGANGAIEHRVFGGPTQVEGGTNITDVHVTSTGVTTVNLDATLEGITSINATGTGALTLSQSGAATAIGGAATVGEKLTVTGVSDLDGGIDVAASNFSVSTAGAIDTKSSLTVAGASTLNGNVTLGNASSDVITINTAASTNNGGKINTSDAIVVLESGVVKTKTLDSIGTAGRYTTFNTVPGSAITTAHHNGVVVLTQSSATSVSVAPPADTSEAGHWIKVINNSTATVTLTGTWLETSDSSVALDDTSANFELIWTGTAGWAIMSA